MAANRSGGNSRPGHVLEAGVVDQHVGLKAKTVESGRVGQVGGHRGAAELAGDPLGAVGVAVDDGHPRPDPARARAQASPMPLAPPVTMLVLPSRSTSINPPPGRSLRPQLVLEELAEGVAGQRTRSARPGA